jgi:tripartite-type tricarboxylate transporter receptor subunit TctC
MMANFRSLRPAAAVLAGAALLFAGTGFAQNWPTKVVRVIVPFGTGGGTDIQARLLAESFRQSTGQTFITENRTGAGGLIGAEIVAKAPGDGYTLLFTSAAISVNTTLFANSLKTSFKFDTRKDLVPVSWLSSTPLVLCTHPSVPAKSVKELITLAKRSAGKLNFGVNTSGTTSHLAAEMMKQRAGFDAVTIAFKGGGPAIVALMTGDIDLLFATGPVAAQNLPIGRIRCLAVTTAKKSSAFPDLPTINTFIPGLEADNWYAMFFPKGTPQDIINKMNGVIKQALQSEKVATFYKREGLDTVASSPQELSEMFEREVKKYAEVIVKAKIQIQ